MSLRILSFGVVSLGIAFPMVSSALAQRNANPAMQRMQAMQPIRTGGTLVSASQNQIQLSTNMNQTIYVMIGPNTEVSVTGTAEQDYLKSGVTVEFVAELDKTHTVKEKIIKMLVVTPGTDRPVGLFPPEFASPDKKSDEKAKPFAPDPGIGDAAPAKGRKKKDADLFGGDSSASKPGKSNNPQFPGTFTVRGTIKMCKDRKITVAAGRGPTVKAELADDVTIDVDMSDLHAAQRDDRVTVDGLTTQARPNMVMAKSIKIELANPLSGAKKHAARPAKAPATHPTKAKKDTSDADDLLGTGK
ncbi:MAG: hypothetical protein ABSG53_26950 [Thermoguttaceae bacterium]